MYSQFFDFMTSRRNAMTSHGVTFRWFYSAYCVQRWLFYHLWKFNQYIFNRKKVTAILVFGSFSPPFTVNVSFFFRTLWGLNVIQISQWDAVQEGDHLVEWMLGHVWDGRVDPGNQRQRGVSASPRETCVYGQTVWYGTTWHQRGNRIKCSKIY